MEIDFPVILVLALMFLLAVFASVCFLAACAELVKLGRRKSRERKVKKCAVQA